MCKQFTGEASQRINRGGRRQGEPSEGDGGLTLVKTRWEGSGFGQKVSLQHSSKKTFPARKESWLLMRGVLYLTGIDLL